MDFFKLPTWLKPSAAIAVNVAIVLSILQPVLVFPLTAQAATDTLFSDSFGSNNSANVSGWTESEDNPTDARLETSTPRPGSLTTGHVRMHEDASIVKTATTTGHTNVVLKYYWRGDNDAEGTDFLRVQWRPGTSGSWISLNNHALNTSTSTWSSEVSVPLGSGADDGTIQIKFIGDSSQDEEDARIDDVSLVGDDMEEVVLPPAPTTGNIHGWKYKDVNGNGTIDGVEPKLGGWTIKLFQGSTLASSTVTSWDGIYNFNGVTPGLYKVCEEMQTGDTGWLQKQPGAGTSCDNGTNGYSVNVAAGDDIYGIDFGNAPGAVIGGWKYRDNNNNGARDVDEPGIKGWTINLYKDGEPVAVTTTTDDKGVYVFKGLEAGTYKVCEAMPEDDQNWSQTDPREDGGSTWRAAGRVACDNSTWGYETTVTTGEEAYSFDFGNVPGALIGGWKYLDANGNGQRDPEEQGIKDWTINLYKDGDLFASHKTLDDKGVYEFHGLPAGNYTVCEDAGDSNEWMQTDPTETGGSTWRAGDRVKCESEGTWGYQINGLTKGAENYSYDFGNNKFAAVRVEKIANPNQGHFEFKLNGPDYEKILSTEGSTAEGSPLEFLKLLPGSYSLAEILPEGWSGTSTSECLADSQVVQPGSLTLTSGLQVRCVYNNSEYGVITGRKFADDNANGSSDQGEPGLAGWVISLLKPTEIPAVPATEETPEVATSTAWNVIDTSVTDEDGAYTFGNLTAGTYRLCEENRAGWTQSLPGSGPACDNGTWAYEFTVDPGSQIINKDFGNWQPGQISGVKWEDTNANGEQDEESGLPGVTIYVDKDGNGNLDNGEPSALTSEGGAYTLTGVTPGVLQVREVVQGEWVQTYPTSTPYHLVTLPSGGNVSDVNFGNHNGPVTPVDTEEPHTIITAPGPNSEWEGNILITGTTTDNVGVASTTLSFAPYIEALDDNDNVGTCGDYTQMTVLDNPSHSAVFDWTYLWTPPSEGSYCIEAKGVDTSGNWEHTARVFPVKFKKSTPPPPPPSDDNHDVISFGGSGGGSSSSFGGTSTPTGTGGNTDEGTGGNNGFGGLVKKLAVAVPTAGFGGTTTIPDLALGGEGTSTGTSTATSSVVGGGSLLAALGGLGGSWLWWIILLIILAGLGGYYYWKKNHQEN